MLQFGFHCDGSSTIGAGPPARGCWALSETYLPSAVGDWDVCGRDGGLLGGQSDNLGEFVCSLQDDVSEHGSGSLEVEHTARWVSDWYGCEWWVVSVTQRAYRMLQFKFKTHDLGTEGSPSRSAQGPFRPRFCGWGQ